MPRTGAYEFKRAAASVDGLVADANKIERGEWAWVEQDSAAIRRLWRTIYARCPDCGEFATLWQSYGDKKQGHDIDAAGNVTPSVFHSWIYQGVEKCGFHTFPTKLLDFIDRRSP